MVNKSRLVVGLHRAARVWRSCTSVYLPVRPQVSSPQLISISFGTGGDTLKVFGWISFSFYRCVTFRITFPTFPPIQHFLSPSLFPSFVSSVSFCLSKGSDV